MKKCSKCLEVLPRDSFYTRSTRDTRLKSACISCTRKIAVERHHQRKKPGDQRRANLWKSFRITLEEYESMFLQQEGRCAICKVDSSELDRNLAVDHCHTSGKIRGLLCSACNTGIGLLRDSEENLQAAIEYLRKSKNG